MPCIGVSSLFAILAWTLSLVTESHTSFTWTQWKVCSCSFSSMQRSCCSDGMSSASTHCNCSYVLQFGTAIACHHKKPETMSIMCLSHHLYQDASCLLVLSLCSLCFTHTLGFCTATTCSILPLLCINHCLDPISWLKLSDFHLSAMQ